MKIAMTRRALMTTAAAAGATAALGRRSRAQAKTLNVLSHRVHQANLTTGDAGNVLKPWEDKAGMQVSWTTLDSNPLQDRLFREASLSATEFNVGYVIDNRMTAEIASLFSPGRMSRRASPE